MIQLIAVVFFLSFFAESIFGFGGLILSFTALSFFLDTREMVYLGLYVASLASLFVIITDTKSFDRKVFFWMLPIALFANVIGVLVFGYITSFVLLKIFAVFLFIFAIKDLFIKDTTTTSLMENKFVQNSTLFAGGLLQGIFGTGGPFTVMAAKDRFLTKSNLRTTMAWFFLSLNIVRVIQLQLQGSFEYQIILEYWWLGIVVFAAVLAGYSLHIRITNSLFRTGISILILLASVVLFFK